MKPVHADDVRGQRRPWWVTGGSPRHALLLAIFYPLLAVVFLVIGLIDGKWWYLPVGLTWLLLAVAGWASYFWYRKSSTDGKAADRGDEGAS